MRVVFRWRRQRWRNLWIRRARKRVLDLNMGMTCLRKMIGFLRWWLITTIRNASSSSIKRMEISWKLSNRLIRWKVTWILLTECIFTDKDSCPTTFNKKERRSSSSHTVSPSKHSLVTVFPKIPPEANTTVWISLALSKEYLTASWSPYSSTSKRKPSTTRKTSTQGIAPMALVK